MVKKCFPVSDSYIDGNRMAIQWQEPMHGNQNHRLSGECGGQMSTEPQLMWLSLKSRSQTMTFSTETEVLFQNDSDSSLYVSRTVKNIELHSPQHHLKIIFPFCMGCLLFLPSNVHFPFLH